jgi:hypothetical protein
MPFSVSFSQNDPFLDKPTLCHRQHYVPFSVSFSRNDHFHDKPIFCVIVRTLYMTFSVSFSQNDPFNDKLIFVSSSALYICPFLFHFCGMNSFVKSLFCCALASRPERAGGIGQRPTGLGRRPHR